MMNVAVASYLANVSLQGCLQDFAGSGKRAHARHQDVESQQAAFHMCFTAMTQLYVSRMKLDYSNVHTKTLEVAIPPGWEVIVRTTEWTVRGVTWMVRGAAWTVRALTSGISLEARRTSARPTGGM